MVLAAAQQQNDEIVASLADDLAVVKLVNLRAAETLPAWPGICGTEPNHEYIKPDRGLERVSADELGWVRKASSVNVATGFGPFVHIFYKRRSRIGDELCFVDV